VPHSEVHSSNPLCVKLPRGVILRDPLLLASGCCGYGEEYADIFSPAEIGGVITKAVSMEPRAGNMPGRLWETPAGLLNCIGLQNPGIDVFTRDVVPQLFDGGFAFILNVVGNSSADFARVVERLEETLAALGKAGSQYVASAGGQVSTGFIGYELDLSCPNVEKGTAFATDLDLLRETVSLCRKNTNALLVAKLAPNVTDIGDFARAAQEAGADAVTVANTWNAISINIATRRSRLSRASAGLSGGSIYPASLYQVWKCHRALPELPILASGGIMDADIAIQFLLAGGTALQLGTGLFVHPGCAMEIRQGILDYLAQQGEQTVSNIIGTYKG
jgi:dihydroorotate dehydrogenase (NAD+) catalytic subunit